MRSNIGVMQNPGATQFTRILAGASSSASERARPCSAALLSE